MAEELHTVVTSTGLHPSEVARRTFNTVRKGLDPAEVRAYLERVGDEMERLAARDTELRQRLADAERRAANPQLDEQVLTRALGQEATRVLASVHEAAKDVKAKAEENASRILAEAHEQASQLRQAAGSVLAERTEEAGRQAAATVAAARAEATAAVDQARAEAEGLVEAARTVGERSIAEAGELRSRVLADLARRRRVLHLQVERLRAGR
ncbi:MAG: DivIVA domain-containing protein, partial [Acidimicrobiales bacterium]